MRTLPIHLLLKPTKGDLVTEHSIVAIKNGIAALDDGLEIFPEHDCLGAKGVCQKCAENISKAVLMVTVSPIDAHVEWSIMFRLAQKRPLFVFNVHNEYDWRSVVIADVLAIHRPTNDSRLAEQLPNPIQYKSEDQVIHAVSDWVHTFGNDWVNQNQSIQLITR